MAFKPIDPNRDEFRRYLERTSVIDALTKAFVHIIRERPNDPIECLRNNLGARREQEDEVMYLRAELANAHSTIDHLRDLINRIDPQALLDGPSAAESVANQQDRNVEIEAQLGGDGEMPPPLTLVNAVALQQKLEAPVDASSALQQLPETSRDNCDETADSVISTEVAENNVEAPTPANA